MKAAELHLDIARTKLHEQYQRSRGFEARAAALAAMACTLALISSLRVLRPRRRWVDNPPMEEFMEGFDAYPDTDPVQWTGRQIGNAVIRNEQVLDAKGSGVVTAVWAVGIMGVAVILLGVAANAYA